MELVTDKTKLWYFPPDSEDDVPRYAILTERAAGGTTDKDIKDNNGNGIGPGFQIYDQIKQLAPEDILKIQPLRVNSDKMQVLFKNTAIGTVNFDNDEAEDQLTNFVAQWKNGLKFLEQSSSKESLLQLRSARVKEEKKRQKVELFKFLCSNLPKYIKPNDINVRIVTWNLQGHSRAFEKERSNIKRLLNVQDHAEPAAERPDIYVINLQETIVLNTLSFYSSPVLVSEWANFILSILNEEDPLRSSRPVSSSSNLNTSDRILLEEQDHLKYDYLVDNRLVGLLTIVIVRKFLKRQITNIEVATTGTGILNMFGNKGAILIKFNFSYDKDILQYLNDEANDLTDEEKQQIVHGYKFVIINTHLTAGGSNLIKRKKELQAIERNLGLREFFKNENFYLINPLLSASYHNSSEIDPFKFNDQEIIKDNRLISLEDLTGNEAAASSAEVNEVSTPALAVPHNNNANIEKFQDVLLSETSSMNKRLANGDETQMASEKGIHSKLTSPTSPTFSLDANTFRNFLGANTQENGHSATRDEINKLTSIFKDCFIFFAGDFNFRLLTNQDDEAKNEIKELLIGKSIDQLLAKDSFIVEKNNLNILSGFNEPAIEFLPTYKCKVKEASATAANNTAHGTNDESPLGIEDLSINSQDEDLPYDFSRVPAYCDRILFSEFNIFDDDTISDEFPTNKHIKVNDYNSIFDFQSSDHKPVYLDLTLQNLQIIDFDERYKLMKDFLKTIDLQENANKPIAEVSPIEIKCENLKFLQGSKTFEFTITNKGTKNFSWKIMNFDEKNPSNFLLVESENNNVGLNNENYLKEPLVQLSATKGVLPATGVVKIKVTLNSLTIGIKKIMMSLILRIIGSKDFFLTCEFKTAPSIFGQSLDLLNNIEGFGSFSGIPPSVYELINYLSNHLNESIFDTVYDFNNPADLKPKILNELDISIRDQLENNNGALDQGYLDQIDKFDIGDNSNSKAVARTLLLLLNNLEGGIIPQEFSTFILEEIALPSVFSSLNFTNNNSNVKFELQSDITTKVLEYVPGLRANVFMYICSFLTLYLSQFEKPKKKGSPATSSSSSARSTPAPASSGVTVDSNHLVSLFEDSIMRLPEDASRALKLKRREVLKIVI